MKIEVVTIYFLVLTTVLYFYCHNFFFFLGILDLDMMLEFWIFAEKLSLNSII